MGRLAAARRRSPPTPAQAQVEAREYQKRHEAGETEEARADLARLKLVREKRAADAARRGAEAEAKAKAKGR